MQLTTEPESQNTEYLCDYVYIDHVRLSHYYSQLSKDGLVTQSKKTARATTKDQSGLQVKALLISGNYGGEATSEEAIEIQIDPAFSRPQETLDALYQAGYIRDGLANGRMGSLILEKGSISLFDIRLLKDIWPHMGETVASNDSAGIANIKERHKAAAAKKKEFDQLAAVMTKMPHSLQGNLAVGDDVAWFTLKPECMLLNPEDLTFKHGSDLKGSWHVLGIVDALPDNLAEENSPFNGASSDLENVMRTMLDALKSMFGRPPDRYGLTPVMIFRVIKKA